MPYILIIEFGSIKVYLVMLVVAKFYLKPGKIAR